MIELRKSYIEDLILLAGSAMDADGIESDDQIRKWANEAMEYGESYTAVAGGKVIAAGGVRFQRPGVGLFWIVVDKNVDR